MVDNAGGNGVAGKEAGRVGVVAKSFEVAPMTVVAKQVVGSEFPI